MKHDQIVGLTSQLYTIKDHTLSSYCTVEIDWLKQPIF
jgi:hypothetical protein